MVELEIEKVMNSAGLIFLRMQVHQQNVPMLVPRCQESGHSIVPQLRVGLPVPVETLGEMGVGEMGVEEMAAGEMGELITMITITIPSQLLEGKKEAQTKINSHHPPQCRQL